MSDFDVAGFVGVGNMGEALLEGILEKNWSAEKVLLYDQDPDRLAEVSERHSVGSVGSLEKLEEKADFLILAVKPADVPGVLKQLGTELSGLISIAAGVTIEDIYNDLASAVQVIRVMPNTPARVGEGMSFLAPCKSGVEDAFLAAGRSIFASVGEVEVVEEKKLDAVTALSGSGPAYVFYFLEALKEAGVYLGLDADEAAGAAEQTLLGAVRLSQLSDKSFSDLREEVSSPGGTTVEAIKHFDESALKGEVIEALNRAAQKSRELSGSD